MDLKIILRTFYLAFLLYLCDRIGAQNVSKSSSLEIDSDISNDQKLKYEVEVLSSVTVDLVESPKKLGEIEFDVEVHEELPQKYQSSPPEIAIIPENGSNKSNPESGVKVEVMTGISVDLVASPKKIGDIEFDIEVEGVVPKKEESRAPEIVVIPKKGDTVLPQYSFGDNGLDYNQTIGDFQFNDMTDFKIKNFGADLDLSDLEKSGSKSSSDDIHLRQVQPDSNQSQSQNESQTQSQPTNIGITGSSVTDTMATTNETEPEQEISTTLSTTTPKSKESSTTIWPIILVAIIFIVLVVIGLIWALKTFCTAKKLEDEEEKQSAATPDGGSVSARSGSVSDSSAVAKSGSITDSSAAAKSGSVTDASIASRKSSASGSSPTAVSQDKKDFSKELSVRSN